MAEEAKKMEERAITLKTVCSDLQEEVAKTKQLKAEVEVTRSGVERAQERLDVTLERLEFLVQAVESLVALVGRVKGHGLRSEAILWIVGILGLLAVLDPLKLFS